MNRALAVTAFIALVGGALGAGYWLGSYPPASHGPTNAGPTAETAALGQRKILYYRHPMGLPDTSPAPKKDSMGMDYVPVYEEEGKDDGTIKISLAKVQRLGVRTESAQLRNLSRAIRAVGTVQMDESRLAVINAKFEGYIEKLHVNTTGQPVQRGQPLMQVYSPELVQAQQEYAVRTTVRTLLNGALQRLRNLDFPADELQRLQREGTANRLITLRSPVAGVVLEKPAVEGMRFMPGDTLLKTADLSSVWLIAEISEQDLGAVHVGQKVRVSVASYPGRDFEGTVSFLSPMLARDTRTARVRVEIPNADGLLRIDMSASVEIAAPVGAGRALTVPDSAVIDSGTRQIVLVERGEGLFEPREVKLGAKAEGYYEITKGVAEGEKVVTSATFLIDAESNLRAALKAFTAPESRGSAR